MFDFDVGDQVTVINPKFKKVFGRDGKVIKVVPHPYNELDRKGNLKGPWYGMVYKVDLLGGDRWFQPADLELAKE